MRRRSSTTVVEPGKTRMCSRCWRVQDLKEFCSTNRMCNRCLTRQRTYVRRRTPNEYERRSLYQSLRRVGITQEEYQTTLEAQEGKCAICKEPNFLHMDHDYNTGKFRGLLCIKCNSGLGHFNDDPIALQKAIDYLCPKERS